MLGHSEEILAEAFAEGAVHPERLYSYTEWVNHFDRLGERWNRGTRTVLDPQGRPYAVGWLDIEINHGVPTVALRRIQQDLQSVPLVQSVEPDIDVPALPFLKMRHGAGKGPEVNGVYQPTFHDLLHGNEGRGVVGRLARNETSAAVIRARLRDVYQDMSNLYGNIDHVDYARMGTVVDAFLVSKGVP